MTVLRQYQVDAIDSMRGHVAAKRNRIMLVLPTGGGKTVIFSEVIRSFISKSTSNRAIVIVHRKELVDQAVSKLASAGVRCGVVMANDSRRADHREVQVCSIQTLVSRIDRLPPAGLVVYDESHHSLAESASKVLDHYSNSILIGCTATPWRKDGLGFKDRYDALVVGATPRQLIDSGSLVECDTFAYDAPDLHSVGTVAGDFNQKDLGVACNTEVLVGSVVREYREHASGRRALLFPVNVEHSKRLVDEFKSHGFPAEHIDWSTPKSDRSGALKRFADGRTHVLSSVGVLTEGFDCPSAEVAILARPTKSLALYIQMVGRVLRPSLETGKKRALVHDHGGNVFRHGFADDDRVYSLTETTQNTREPMCCTDCGACVRRWRQDGTCPHCGSLQSMPEETKLELLSSRGKQKQVVEGRRIGRDEIMRIREMFADAGVDRELTDGEARKVAGATRGEKASEYLRLQAVAREKGFKPGFVSHQYRAAFAVWPKFRDGELDNVEPATKPFLPYVRREPWALPKPTYSEPCSPESASSQDAYSGGQTPEPLS